MRQIKKHARSKYHAQLAKMRCRRNPRSQSRGGKISNYKKKQEKKQNDAFRRNSQPDTWVRYGIIIVHLFLHSYAYCNTYHSGRIYKDRLVLIWLFTRSIYFRTDWRNTKTKKNTLDDVSPFIYLYVAERYIVSCSVILTAVHKYCWTAAVPYIHATSTFIWRPSFAKIRSYVLTGIYLNILVWYHAVNIAPLVSEK